MAEEKKKNSTKVVEAGTTVLDGKGEQVNKPLPEKVDPKAVPTKENHITIDMYFSQKKTPVQHRAGMRAFTPTRSATFAEWNTLFKNY